MATKVHNERSLTKKAIFVEQKSDNGRIEIPKHIVDYGDVSKQLKDKKNYKLEVETDIGKNIVLEPGSNLEVTKEKEFERNNKLVHQYKVKRKKTGKKDEDKDGDEDMTVKDPPP